MAEMTDEVAVEWSDEKTAELSEVWLENDAVESKVCP